MFNKLFEMPKLDMYEYEVEDIMSATSPDPQSEIEDGGEDYI